MARMLDKERHFAFYGTIALRYGRLCATVRGFGVFCVAHSN